MLLLEEPLQALRLMDKTPTSTMALVDLRMVCCLSCGAAECRVRGRHMAFGTEVSAVHPVPPPAAVVTLP
ncbi:MAG: hypothetical protein NVSMB55_01180 [Mycobacteriales bacterium]